MNIKTIGENLTQLMDKIGDEKGLGNAAKVEILKAIDEVIDRNNASTKAMESLKQTIAAHMDERSDALDALLDEPAQALEDKKAA